MTRFHDSRFQGVRLVTRLRKTPGSASSPVSGPGGTIPSGPSAQQQQGSTQSQTAVEAIAQNRESSQKATEASQPADASVNDKYFVVKSLTVEDLELSVRNGIWATQGHNEDALNKAYEVNQPTARQLHRKTLTFADGGKRLPHFLGEQIRRVFWLRSHGFSHQRRNSQGSRMETT